MSRLLSSAAVAVAALAATSVVAASGPVFWTVAAPGELLKGTSNGVIVGLDGAITAGPQTTARLTTTPAQIWSLAAAADGTLWAGTGGDGRLIRLRPGQAEETVFTAEEKNIFAIATSGTRVYFATGPEGKVYVIDGAGAPRVFFDPSEKYVWALAVDRAGRLWVGAGNPAIVYRVDPGGTSQVIYRPSAAHVVSLALDAQDRMLAGTESPGRLYRFEAGDRPFVVLDSGLAQLAGIAVSPGGVVYAAAIAKGDEGSSSAGESVSVAIVTAPPPTPGASTSTSSSGAGRKSVVYRIDTAGTYETFWETSDVVYDLAASGDNGVIVASGPEGRVYRIDRNRQVQLIGGVDAKQVTHLVGAARGGDMPVAMATANPGRVIALGTATQSPASYTSPVRDTKSVSLWGLIRWEGAGGVQLFTRSGNTETPDDSWSDWGGPYTRAGGEAIKSPAARFVQWRAVLTQGATPAPRLTSVTVAYLPRNTRPAVSSVTTYPPGVVFQKPFSSEDGAIAGLDDATADARRPPGDPGPNPPTPGRRMFQKGLQTIAWKADDSDSDHLTYSLQYRREGEATWHDLRTGLSDSIFVWDTTSVADGRYIVKVLASDSPSNAADRALVGERDSDPIEIDNTPPTIATEILRQGAAIRLGVHVRDARSAIQKVEYSIGGGPWQLIAPVDGLADSPDERYEISIANEADAARIMIRATDVLGNVVAQSATIR
ncbi:MAG TPA: two-component regulator propeller domain-containing protein [Vicinamibacterales bacterium]|nr:two-component regulator propeller domain-containing protein [Vicinamibacterales bacterium]